MRKSILAATVALLMLPAVAQAQISAQQEPKPVSTLNINSDPAGATVAIDGMQAGKTPAHLKDISPGEHVIRLVKDGYSDTETTLSLNPGESRNVKMTLEELPDTREKRIRYQSALDHYEAAMEEYRAIATPKKIAGWTLFGAGLAAGGAAAAVIILGNQQAQNAYDKYSQTVDTSKMDNYWSDVQSSENMMKIGYGVIAGSAVLLATSFYFLFTIPSKPVEPKPITMLIPEPSLANGMPVLTWRGTF